MNHAELVMRRRNVLAFIQADPVSIELVRLSEPVKTDAGGFIAGQDAPLTAQQGRIVQNKRRFNNGIINSEAGDIPHTDYLLIMTYDKDVAVDDHFMWLNEHYQVTGIHEQRTESILCSIDFYGKKNRARA